MNIPKVSRWFSLLLFMTIVVSCTQLTEGTAATSPVASASPVSSASPTETISVTSTSMGTPTLLFTPTAAPTLSVEDARKRLLELLATNGNCRLPCLWGISPGKSLDREAQSILSPLSSISILTGFRDGLGSISPIYPDNGDLRLSIDAGFLSRSDQIVSHVNFRALEEQVVKDPRDPSGESWISKTPLYGMPSFIKRVEYYSLSHLLNEQGVPASVMIASSGPSYNRTGSIFTQIAVLYPDQGIWAQYTTLVNENEVGSSIKSCPINAHIEMELYPPGNPDSFFSLLDETDWGVTKNEYKPLEEATSMSVEEFYQIFRNPTDKCIETPTNLWPTPER